MTNHHVRGSHMLLRATMATLAALFTAGSVYAQTATADTGTVASVDRGESGGPTSRAAIDCAAIAINMAPLNRLIIRPGRTSAQAIIREAFPHDMPLDRRKQSLELDPAGLCTYRNADRSLPPATRNRVVFIGDSITEIWGLADPGFFTGDIIDRGIAGQTTSQMLLRFRDDVIDLKPSVVHIMGGVNDIITPAGTALTRANIESMVDLAESHGIRVVLGSITPCSSFFLAPKLKPAPQIITINKWLKEFARRRRLVYVDYYTPLADANGGLSADLTNDALHPNARGFALMTPIAAAALAGPR